MGGNPLWCDYTPPKGGGGGIRQKELASIIACGIHVLLRIVHEISLPFLKVFRPVLFCVGSENQAAIYGKLQKSKRSHVTMKSLLEIWNLNT